MACRIRIKLQGSGFGDQGPGIRDQGSGAGDRGSEFQRIKEDTMLTRCFILIGLIATLLIFSGCGTRETMLSRNWGSSFESAKQSQILNPEAGKNLDPVVGLDGQATGNNMEKYRQGFKKDTSKEMTLTIQSK